MTHFWMSWYVFHVMNFLTSWRVFIFMTNCLIWWRIFDFMTHFLTSWHILDFMTNLWRHDKPFDVMVCLWSHDELGDVMTNFVTSWQTLWRYYVFLLHFMINFVTSWRLFYVVFWSNDELFEVMMKLLTSSTNFLTSWRIFWHHDVFMTLYYDEFVMWQAIDVMTCVALIDVIIIILTPGTFWQHNAFYWHPDTLFDLMTNIFTTFLSFWLYFFNELVWCHGMPSSYFHFVRNVLTSWRTFLTFDVFLTLWRVIDVITSFWRHDKLFDDMANVLTLWTFNVMTHFLRL